MTTIMVLSLFFNAAFVFGILVVGVSWRDMEEQMRVAYRRLYIRCAELDEYRKQSTEKCITSSISAWDVERRLVPPRFADVCTDIEREPWTSRTSLNVRT